MTAPELPFEQRLAGDLRALAQFAETHPPLGRELGHYLRRIVVVVPGGVGLVLADFAEPLAAVGATETAADIADDRWDARTWVLPAGLIHLTATQLALPSD